MRQRVKKLLLVPYHKRTLNSKMRRDRKRRKAYLDNKNELLILLDELLK